MRIELVDAEYISAGQAIVHKINLLAEPERPTIIRGRSASGKSTLAGMLGGLVQPTDGCWMVDGEPIQKPKSLRERMIRQQIGLIEQSPSFYEHLSAFENVLVAAAVRGCSSADATTQALERFADLGISHIRTRIIDTLSAWERILVASARALVGRTSTIIADQCFDGHDEISIRTLLDVLVRDTMAQRTIIVTTTSSTLDELLPHASVYELRDGLLVNISKLSSEESQTQNGEQS